jgi:CspA family cold shock protein
MVFGTVKFFNAQEKYGFISGDDGKDYYFHITGLKRGEKVMKGERVSFEVSLEERGSRKEDRAVEVEVIHEEVGVKP